MRGVAPKAVEKKPAVKKPLTVVNARVRLHPSVTATSCMRCSFLDRAARLCELFDVELDYESSTAHEFARAEACVDAQEAAGGSS